MVPDPVQALVEAYKNYLRSHGTRIFSLASACGQEYVLTSISSLYRYHDPTTGYRRLDDAVSAITGDEELSKRLMEYGLEIVKIEEELYIKSSLDAIKRLTMHAH